MSSHRLGSLTADRGIGVDPDADTEWIPVVESAVRTTGRHRAVPDDPAGGSRHLPLRVLYALAVTGCACVVLVTGGLLRGVDERPATPPVVDFEQQPSDPGLDEPASPAPADLPGAPSSSPSMIGLPNPVRGLRGSTGQTAGPGAEGSTAEPATNGRRLDRGQEFPGKGKHKGRR